MAIFLMDFYSTNLVPFVMLSSISGFFGVVVDVRERFFTLRFFSSLTAA